MKVFLLLIFIAGSFSAAEASTFYEAYQKGIELENQQQWNEAREHFLEAARLRPMPGRRVRTAGMKYIFRYDPYIHLAHCEARLGMFEEAKKHFEIAKRANVTPPPLLNEIERRFKRKEEGITSSAEQTKSKTKPAIEKPVAKPTHLRVLSTPPGANIVLNEKQKGRTPWNSTVEPGVYSVRLELDGFETIDRKVELSAGDNQTLDITFTKSPATEITGSESEDKKEVGSTEPNVLPARTSPAPVQPAPDRRLSSPIMISFIAVILLISTIAFVYHTRKNTASRASSHPESGPVSPSETPTESIPPTTVQSRGMTPESTKPLPENMEKTFGAYRLEGVVGKGGMGTTYLAIRLRDELQLVLKIPHDHLLDHQEFIARFLREGQLGSTLHHPNIIRIYESGTLGTKPYIAMELLRGETLEKHLQARSLIPIRSALEIARDIALALDYARLKGIIHRDLKPENIMMLERGGLKVMDYGIARVEGSPALTSSYAYLGTPSYSSPESTNGEIGQQSDLYSLGIILYRMLTGGLPFRSTDPLQVLMMHRNQPLPDFPPTLQIPNAVFAMVKRLSEKDKKDRYPNAEAFLVDLNRFLNIH